MKNIYAVLLVMSVGFMGANAQVPKGMGASDPQAKKILDNVSIEGNLDVALTKFFNFLKSLKAHYRIKY